MAPRRSLTERRRESSGESRSSPRARALKGEDTGKVTEVYQEIMGRGIDAQALSEFKKSGLSVAEQAKHWATSREALDRGVDPAKYGARTVDPEQIPDALKPFYSVWREKNPNAPLYDANLTQLRWHKDAGDVNAYRAELNGLIRREIRPTQGGGSVEVRIVTPEALATMGGKVTLRGNRAGDFILAPDGAEMAGGLFKEAGSVGGGFTAFGATGNLSTGVLGSLGIDKILPKELMALDITGTTASILGGRKARDASREWTAGVTGLKESEVGRIGDIAAAVAITVGTMGAGSPAAAAAIGAGGTGLHSTGKVMAGDISSREAFTRTATAGASAYGGAAAAAAGHGTAGIAAGRAAGEVAGAFAGEAIGVDANWQAIGLNSATSIAHGAVGHTALGAGAVRAGFQIATGAELMDALPSFAVGYATQGMGALSEGAVRAWESYAMGGGLEESLATGALGYVGRTTDRAHLRAVASIAPSAIRGDIPTSATLVDAWQLYRGNTGPSKGPRRTKEELRNEFTAVTSLDLGGFTDQFKGGRYEAPEGDTAGEGIRQTLSWMFPGYSMPVKGATALKNRRNKS